MCECSSLKAKSQRRRAILKPYHTSPHVYVACFWLEWCFFALFFGWRKIGIGCVSNGTSLDSRYRYRYGHRTANIKDCNIRHSNWFVCVHIIQIPWMGMRIGKREKYNSAYVSACLRVSESFIWCVRHFFARIKRIHCHIILIANFMEMTVEGWQITKICLLHISHLKGTPTLDCARCLNEWMNGKHKIYNGVWSIITMRQWQQCAIP